MLTCLTIKILDIMILMPGCTLRSTDFKTKFMLLEETHSVSNANPEHNLRSVKTDDRVLAAYYSTQHTCEQGADQARETNKQIVQINHLTVSM